VKLEPAPLNDCKMPSPDPNVKRRNWLVLVILAAVALAIYVGFIVKAGSPG
jgi:hypothetical protein